MTPTYTVHRKDRNEDELLNVAKRCGASWIKGGPLDGWAFVRRWGCWYPVELKMPEREGAKDEFTPAQIKFMNRCKDIGAKYLIWRTREDVIESIGGRL